MFARLARERVKDAPGKDARRIVGQDFPVARSASHPLGRKGRGPPSEQ
jgi:hypothetical protein